MINENKLIGEIQEFASQITFILIVALLALKIFELYFIPIVAVACLLEILGS